MVSSILSVEAGGKKVVSMQQQKRGKHIIKSWKRFMDFFQQALFLLILRSTNQDNSKPLQNLISFVQETFIAPSHHRIFMSQAISLMIHLILCQKKKQ